MKITRRTFVKGGVSTFTLGFIAPALFTDMARAQAATDRNFVVLNLAGGVDGLSVVVPYKDPSYFSRRPTISLPETSVLQIGTDTTQPKGIPLGLHPRLTGLKKRFDDGKLAIVQRVGYANSSRSHFMGTDIVSTGDVTDNARFGWVGRYLDSLGASLDPLYAWNSTSATPRVLLAPIYDPPAIPSITTYSYRTNNTGAEGALEKAMAAQIASHVPVNQPHVALVQQNMTDALETVDRVANVGTYKPSVTYPTNGLGSALQMVAGAITKNIGTKVFFVQLGGFDTHAAQQTRAGNFFNLMATLDDGLAAFYTDLKQQGLVEKTLIMTFSEFGRRVSESSSAGTDHGAANNVLILGGTVKGGLYGTSPDLTPAAGNKTLESNGADVTYETDFRSIYAAIAQNWLQTDAKALLGDYFPSPNVGFL